LNFGLLYIVSEKKINKRRNKPLSVKGLPILGDPPERVRTPYELIERFYDGQEHRPVRPLLLPAVQHQLVYGFWTVHRRW